MAELNQKIICLLTDFGAKGFHYVASMKGIIFKINPKVKIIDLSHYISSYSIIEASYVLKTTYKHFPKGTVFVIVVDPGVGSSREIVAIRTNSNYFFIGPNNGIFPNVLNIREISECVNIENEIYFNKPVSNTFHGRDIMAPVGAYITKDASLNNIGPNLNFENLTKHPMIYELNSENKLIKCLIQYIDSFGNGTTTIPMVDNCIQNSEFTLEDGVKIKVRIRQKEHEGVFASHFSSVPLNSLLFLVGSTGFLEISINQGNASKKLDFKVGDILSVKL